MIEAQSPAAWFRPTLSLGALVWLLGLTQIVGYGTLYYGFAILAGDIAGSFGYPLSSVYGAFSAALLVGGLVAPVAGRRIDRHGAGRVMAYGSLASALVLALTALAPTPLSFAIGLGALELVASTVLYDAAFACLVQAAHGHARRRITHLTLIAGFASTLFWPLTASLHAHLDWRGVMLVFAAMNLAISAPVHALIARARIKPAPAATEAAAFAASSDAPLPAGLRKRALVLVTLGFALAGFVLSSVLAQMVPLLGALGLGSSAVLVSSLFGPAQVAVRFVTIAAGAGRHPIVPTLIACAAMPASVLLLALTAPGLVGAIGFAILFGFGSGLTSIVRGTLPLALFGGAAFGERLGRMASIRLGFTALAPFFLSFMLDQAGPTVTLVAIAGVGSLGLAAFVAVARLGRTPAAAPAA